MSGTKPLGYKEVLKNENCRKLLIASLINRFGDSIDAIAFMWLVYQITGNATWSAIIFGLNQLPGVFILPLAGAWVEGKDKKKIIIVTDIIRGLIIGGFASMYLFGIVSPYIMAAFTLVITTVESFNGPAMGAFMPELVKGDEYVSTRSLKTTLTQVINVVGISFAGVIIAEFGIGFAMIIDMTTFFIESIIIAKISYTKHEMADKLFEGQPYLKKLVNGFKYIKTNSTIIFYCVISVIMNAVLTPLNSLITPLVSEAYGKDSQFLSIITGAQWVGAFLASFILPKVTAKISFEKAVGVLGVIEGVACYLLAQGGNVKNVIASFMLAEISMFVIGFTMSILSGLLGISFVKKVAPDYLARVSASFDAVATASAPAVTFAVSIVTVKFDVVSILSVTGIVGFVIFSGISLGYFIRKIKEQNAYAT